MEQSRLFGDKAPIELIDGMMIEKMTQYPPHSLADGLCDDELARVVPPGWHARGAKPVRLPPQDAKPEPDRCVVRGTKLDYAFIDPGPGDIALVVEVADSSLEQDRGRKLSAYARAGIPVYWIVNVVECQVEVYTMPSGETYRSREDYQPGQTFAAIIAGSNVGEISVDAIFPLAKTKTRDSH
jgi:Uma2 family endonuclease